MNLRTIGALVSKDLSLFFRNRFFAIVTVLGLVTYLVIYFLMPSSVDETLKVGLYAPVMPPVFEQVREEGLEIEVVETEEILQEGVTEGDYIAGVALPADMMEKFLSGQKPEINLYFAADTPAEIKDAVVAVIRELAYQQTGQALAIEVSEEILGPDMLGMQIPPRDRLRPLLAVILIIFETLGLANLITEEVERGTIHALLVTPMSINHLFVAKGVVGVSLASGQGIVFMAIAGGMSHQPLLIVVALFLGAVMATGAAFIIASLGKDFMTVLSWGILVFVVLAVPSFSILLPGALTGWVKVIPSYYLVNIVHQVAGFGAGWSDVWQDLLILLGADFVMLLIGITALRRKTR